MKMLTLVSATALALAIAACSKDSDKKGDDAPPPGQNPGLSAVEPSFKNTAKSGKEVAARLDEVAGKLQQSDLSLRGTSQRGGPSLKMAKMRAFLADDDQDSGASAGEPPQGLDLQDGDDCATMAGRIAHAYTSAVDSLKTTAESLRSWDEGDLPDGVTRNQTDAKFAVSYSVDLDKLLSSATKGPSLPPPFGADDAGDKDEGEQIPPFGADGDDDKGESEEDQIPPFTDFTVPAPVDDQAGESGASPSSEPDRRVPTLPTAAAPNDGDEGETKGPTLPGLDSGNITGKLVFGVGASSTEVGAELSVDAALNDQQGMSATTKLGIAAYANEVTQEVKTRTNYVLAQTSQEGSGSFSGAVTLTLRGGANVAILANATAKGTKTAGGWSETTEASFDARLEKQSDSEILLSYDLVGDGKTQAGKVRLVNDGNGRCIVKNELPTN